MICFYYGLTAFACIWYFRHELFVNAQSFVFKLLFPLLLARFHQLDRREAEGVGDMPIATQDLGGASELVRTQWFQRVLCHSRPPFPTRDSAGRRG